MNNKPRILLYLDDFAHRELISDILLNEACHVVVADDFYDAIEALALDNVVGAVIGIDEGQEEGFRLIRLIDENVLNVSIMSVGKNPCDALASQAYKVGSHDCHSLSVSTPELRLALRGLKKRIGDRQRSLIELGNLTVDTAHETFYANRIQIHFSPVESRLLLALAKQKNAIISMGQLKKIAFFNSDAASDCKIYKLLKAIKTKLKKAGVRRARIENIKGKGYVLYAQSMTVLPTSTTVASAQTS